MCTCHAIACDVCSCTDVFIKVHIRCMFCIIRMYVYVHRYIYYVHTIPYTACKYYECFSIYSTDF